MGIEMFLDTKGTCFLCLQESLAGAEDSDANNEVVMEVVCLRNFCRYLKINPCTVLNKLRALGVVDGESFGNEKCDFSVMLCPSCSSLTKNISDLFGQMEIMRMLMHHQLRVLNQMINYGEKEKECHDGELWRRLQEKMGVTCDNPFEFEPILVEHLRQIIMEMCSSKVKIAEANTLPRLNIKRLDLNLSGGQRQDSSNTEPPWEPPQTVKYRCKQCSFHDVSADPSRICRHLVNLHPETLFTAAKLPEISDKVFNYCCQRLLVSQTESVDINEWENKNLCSFCNKKCSTGYDLRYHLVLEHFAILEEKLILLQREMKIDEDEHKQGIQVPIDDPESLDDEPPPILIDQTLPNYYYLNYTKYEKFRMENNKSTQNKNDKHPNRKDRQRGTGKDGTEDKIPPNLIEKESSLWICDLSNGGCGKKFSSQYTLDRHKIQVCAKLDNRLINLYQNSRLKVTSRNINSTPTQIATKPNEYRCKGGCGKTFPNITLLRRHRIHFCPKRRNPNNLFTCTSDNGGCGKQFSSESGLNRHRKYRCSKNNKLRKMFLCKFTNGGGVW